MGEPENEAFSLFLHVDLSVCMSLQFKDFFQCEHYVGGHCEKTAVLAP